MKKIFLLIFPLVAISASAMDTTIPNLNNYEEITSVAFKRVIIDKYIAGAHVYGWVDIDGPVKHYDIYVQIGPIRSHYVGKMSVNESGDTIIDGTLTDEKGNTIRMDDDTRKVLIETNSYIDQN